MSSTDALFTRFEELFREYLQRLLIVGFGHLVSLHLEPTKRDLLRQFFDLSWDKKELPSKKLLMEVVQFIGPPPIRGFDEVEEHVAESFDLALEKLKFEETKQDEEETVSLPEKPQQKSKQGRRTDPKIQKRRDIIKKYIHASKDWFDPSIKEKLLDEFDEEEIPFPKDSESFPKSIVIWAEFIKDYPADDWKRVVDKVLDKDRWR